MRHRFPAPVAQTARRDGEYTVESDFVTVPSEEAANVHPATSARVDSVAAPVGSGGEETRDSIAVTILLSKYIIMMVVSYG
jgi:hypothetical protein